MRLASLLMTFMFLTAVAACGVSGYLFWENEICETGSRGCPRGSGNSTGTRAGRAAVRLNEYGYRDLKPTARTRSGSGITQGLSIRVAEQKSFGGAGKYLPEYRSPLVMLITHQTYEDLATDEGKRRLMIILRVSWINRWLLARSIRVTDININNLFCG